MKPFSRSDRVGGQIKKILSDLLQKRIKDPRLRTTTITGVTVSQDLRLAKVYFMTSGGENTREQVADGFKNASGYVKRSLARQLGLRYMPDLKFFYDESFDYGSRIDKVLNAIKTEDGSDNTPIEKQ